MRVSSYNPLTQQQQYSNEEIIRAFYFILFLLLVSILILVILVYSSNNGVSTMAINSLNDPYDYSCGIPGPCQITIKNTDGKCIGFVNKPVGTPCTSSCVNSGVCAVDYSLTSNGDQPIFFCNATNINNCLGFCNTVNDCPIPNFIPGLPPVGVGCIKGDTNPTIGTCYYAQSYAQFYNSGSSTVNWFIDTPQRGPDINSIISQYSDICNYIILNPNMSTFDVLNPDPSFNKECLKYQSFFYQYDYGDYCVYQYECTRPDYLGYAIPFLEGGFLIGNWGIYSIETDSIRNIVLNNYTNITDFLQDFLSG